MMNKFWWVFLCALAPIGVAAPGPATYRGIASAVSGAPQEGRLSNQAFASLARELARQPSGVLNRRFALSDVLAAKLTITQRDGELNEAVIWRNAAGAFETARGPLPLGVMQVLAEIPGAAKPALGLHSCSGVDESFGPPREQSVQIRILIRERRPLQLFSSSSCLHRLPWNVTDGERFAVVDQESPGQGLAALVQALCPECQVSSGFLPPPGMASRGDANFSQHYRALLSEWRRLGQRQSLTWVVLHTVPLISALKWMDRPRFEQMLERSAKAEAGGVAQLAGNTLQMLHQQRWGYIDTAGKWVLPRRFDAAGPFGGDSALVRLDDEWQLIDRNGQPAQNAHTGEPSYLPIRLKPTEKDSQWGIIDAQGVWVIPAQFEAARDFSEGLAAVQRAGLWGYIDEKGYMVISPGFNEAGDFGQGLAPVR
jgi:hypothetical protein